MFKKKNRPWFAERIDELNHRIAELEASLLQMKMGQNGDAFNIDTYIKGYYECLCSHGMSTKDKARIICKKIRERYKGAGDTSFVRKLR